MSEIEKKEEAYPGGKVSLYRFFVEKPGAYEASISNGLTKVFSVRPIQEDEQYEHDSTIAAAPISSDDLGNMFLAQAAEFDRTEKLVSAAEDSFARLSKNLQGDFERISRAVSFQSEEVKRLRLLFEGQASPIKRWWINLWKKKWL